MCVIPGVLPAGHGVQLLPCRDQSILAPRCPAGQSLPPSAIASDPALMADPPQGCSSGPLWHVHSHMAQAPSDAGHSYLCDIKDRQKFSIKS